MSGCIVFDVVFRLKYLLRKAESDQVCKEELVSHLGYIVNVLDAAFSEESKSVKPRVYTLHSVADILTL